MTDDERTLEEKIFGLMLDTYYVTQGQHPEWSIEQMAAEARRIFAENLAAAQSRFDEDVREDPDDEPIPH
jgi:hypothetical protein